MMYIRIEFLSDCTATLIKGLTFDKPQIMYGMIAGQVYTANQNVNFYLLFQSTAQVSGKFVFSIWFKSMPGTGSLQPTKVTLPVIEEEKEKQPDDGIAFGPDIVPEETTDDTTVPPNELTGTNTNIKNVTNPFEIPVNTTIPIQQPSPTILPTNTSTTIIKNNITTTSTKGGDSFDAKPEKAGNSAKPDTPAEILKDVQATKPNNTEANKPIFD